MIDIIALGELLIDFASVDTDEGGYPIMVAHPGGAPGNFLASASAYGLNTAFIGKVGDDTFGKMLIDTMRQAGVETRGIVKSSNVFTTLAFVTIDHTGDRSFNFVRKPGADTCLTYEEVDKSLIDQAKALHFGTLSLTDEPAKTATKKAVAYARERGKLITFDPNLRISLWKNSYEAREQLLWGLGQADIVKISDEEVEFLFDCNEATGANKLLNEYAAKLVMVTLGPRGCYLKNRLGEVYERCPPVKVLDTTGAGDIFGGSAMSRILKLRKKPENIGKNELVKVAKFACTAASLSTEVSGGIPSIPSEEKVIYTMDGL